MRARARPEKHRIGRIGWLRAAVLGANDGIISTGSLMLGVAVAGLTEERVLLTGLAGLVAGAMSMAAGEYVSIQSQADTESADLLLEAAELRTHPAAEQRELAAIYVGRGIDAELAQQVAGQLMVRDALGAHARDELGISPVSHPRPVQAAVASAASFAVGAALPLAAAAFAPAGGAVACIVTASLASLALLGLLAARAGGARVATAVVRITVWGALALAVTAGAGALFGVAT